MNLIVKMIFGSHLYGTNTEESDTDYKGVYLPTRCEMYLGEIIKSINTNTKIGGSEGVKNTKDDIDCEIYSLQYFIKMALEGQTNVIDMLHAPDNMIVKKSFIWDLIVANRHKFYTKSMKSFIGYARTQAAKYGIKGSRLNDCCMVLDFLNEKLHPQSPLGDVWNELPIGDYVKKVNHLIKNSNEKIEMYQVVGKKFQKEAKSSYVFASLLDFYNKFGERAKMAADNKGLDWKAISHALRAGYQFRQILIDKTITYPLKEAKYLREVKQGKYRYIEEVAPVLEALMEEVEALSIASNLPESPDVLYWKNFIEGVCIAYAI